ncbi:MAG: hypothetical protein WAN49_09845, partial [Pseudolabrys sp.]
ALRDGGYVIVFRHGATYQDQADTDPLNPSNAAKQRQLDDDGRALAKSIGESMRKLKIPVGQIHTSLFQRAIETGALMDFGDVRASADYTEGRTRGYSYREQPPWRGLAQDSWNDAICRHQHHRGHAQAEHSRCFRQRLVRCARGRGFGVQA